MPPVRLILFKETNWIFILSTLFDGIVQVLTSSSSHFPALFLLFFNKSFIFFICLYVFFTRVQRNRTSSEAAKEGTAVHLSAFCGYPSLLTKSSRLGKSYPLREVLRRGVLLLFIPLPGSVKY
jgi:hypothetical protein